LSAAGTAERLPTWDIYCRVVDNFGDAGVLWRLARGLAAGHRRRVRLWIDRIDTLAVLVPGAAGGTIIDAVRIEDWVGSEAADLPDVLVTGFDCAPPPAVRNRMRPGNPLWITVEHLSAESWVARFHGSPSPKPDGCVEHFFYPGFSPGTGGLLLEPGVLAARDAALDRPTTTNLRLLAFGYPASPLALLLRGCRHDAAHGQRTWEVIVPSPSGRADRHRLLAPGVQLSRVPFVAQSEFDRRLRDCDINFVRGEDSWVRAIWAARPFVWQAWRQELPTRSAKVEAFLRSQAQWLDSAGHDPLAWLSRWWNGLSAPTTPTAAAVAARLAAVVEATPRIGAQLGAWGDALSRRELTAELIRFAIEKTARQL
jgi:uncharacterized repeat protein (TIGR03837 family)